MAAGDTAGAVGITGIDGGLVTTAGAVGIIGIVGGLVTRSGRWNRWHYWNRWRLGDNGLERLALLESIAAGDNGWSGLHCWNRWRPGDHDRGRWNRGITGIVGGLVTTAGAVGITESMAAW